MTKIINLPRKMMAFFDKYNDKINNFLPIFLLSYFILVFLPYVVADIPFLNNFFMGAITKLLYRAFTTSYLCGYGILLGFTNKQGIKWHFVIPGSILLTCYFLSIILSPKQYMYVTIGLTHRVDFYSFNLGTYSYITYGFSFFADVVSFIIFLSYFPCSMKNIKQLYPTLTFLTSFMFIACAYSIIKERNDVIQVLKGGSEYSFTVRSFFHSKNAFGLYLFVGALASAFMFMTLGSKLRWMFALLLFVFTGMAFLAMCKSAFLCCLILDLFVLWLLIFFSKGATFYISLCFGIILVLAAVTLIIIVTIPSIRESHFSGLYNLITRLINGIFTRTDRWEMVKYVVYDEFVFIGMNESNSTFFLEIMSKITQNLDILDFHSAYVTWYAHHGVIGCIIYGLLVAYIFLKTVKTWKTDKKTVLLLLAILVVCLIFMVPESYILFVSISSYSFLINMLLLCSLNPNQLSFIEKEEQNETL